LGRAYDMFDYISDQYDSKRLSKATYAG
jgi:hypothetical protein